MLKLHWRGVEVVVLEKQLPDGEQQWSEACVREENLLQSLSGRGHYEAVLGKDCVVSLL